MMKALPFAYPKDRSLRNIKDEFLFGNSLLVNPVTTAHATSRSVVLPAGVNWVDFWTGQTYQGGQTIHADAPLNRIPILVKEGSIVPMGPVVQSTAETEGPLEIRVNAGKDADFLLYQDSGDGYAYEKGERAVIPLHWNDRQGTLSIGARSGSFPGMRNQQSLQIVIVKRRHGAGIASVPDPDRTVMYNGHAMTVHIGKSGKAMSVRGIALSQSSEGMN